MNHYELLFVVKPTLTDDEIKVQIAKVQDSITAQEGEIVSVKDMGMRKLAYPVQKNERGYYTVIYFKSPASAIAEIERLIRINEEILKFLTVKFTNKKEIAQFEKMSTATVEKKEVSTQEAAPKEESPQEEPKTEVEVTETAEVVEAAAEEVTKVAEAVEATETK